MSIFRPFYRALPAKAPARANQLLLRHANEQQQQNGTTPLLSTSFFPHHVNSRTNIYSTNRLLHGSSFFSAVESSDPGLVPDSIQYATSDPSEQAVQSVGGPHMAQLISQYLPIVSALVRSHDYSGLIQLVKSFTIGYPPLTTADKHIFLNLILDELVTNHVPQDQTESITKSLLEQFHIHPNSTTHLKLAEYSFSLSNIDRAYHWFLAEFVSNGFNQPIIWERFFLNFIRKKDQDHSRIAQIYATLARFNLAAPVDVLVTALDIAAKTRDASLLWAIVDHADQCKGFLPKIFFPSIASELLKHDQFDEVLDRVQQLPKGTGKSATNGAGWRLLVELIKQISNSHDLVLCVNKLNVEKSADSLHRHITNLILNQHNSYSLDELAKALRSDENPGAYFFNLLKLFMRSHVDSFAVVNVLRNVQEIGLKVHPSIQALIDQFLHQTNINPKLSVQQKDSIRAQIELIFPAILDCSPEECNVLFDLYLMNRRVLMQSQAQPCVALVREILDSGLNPSAPAISHTLSKLLTENMYDQGIQFFYEVRPILHQIKDNVGWTLACAPSYSFAIRHHCRRGHHREASELLRELISQNSFMDSYASAEFVMMVRRINGTVQATQVGFEFFNTLRHHHIKIQTYFVNVLLNACIESDQLSKVWDVQRKISDIQLEVDLVSYGTFIKAALKENDYPKAKAFFQNVLDAPKLKRDMISRPSIFHQLIEHSIEVSRDYDETTALFKMMDDLNLPTDERTQALQFRFYTQLTPYQLDKINPLIKRIRADGHFFSQTHFRILILNLTRLHGEVEWAYDLFVQLTKSQLQIHLDMCHAFVHALFARGRDDLAHEVHRAYTRAYPKADTPTLDQMREAPATYVNTSDLIPPKHRF